MKKFLKDIKKEENTIKEMEVFLLKDNRRK